MLKASTLKKSDVQKKIINKEANMLLSQIDDEIKVAHDSGKHSVLTTLPIHFSLSSISNAEAQRVIYYKIVSSLKNRGFIVKLQLKEDTTLLYITWVTDEEREEEKIQNEVLARHRVRDLSQVEL